MQSRHQCNTGSNRTISTAKPAHMWNLGYGSLPNLFKPEVVGSCYLPTIRGWTGHQISMDSSGRALLGFMHPDLYNRHRHSRKGLRGPFKPRASRDGVCTQESKMRLLVRPVCPQSTSETPTYKGESWWGLKPPVPRKAVRVWSVAPTLPQQGKPGCEVGLVSRALNKENKGGKRSR